MLGPSPGKNNGMSPWPRLTYRIGALYIVLGLALIAAALIPHPPTTDPNDAAGALREITATRPWALIHWLGAAGFLSWLIGPLALHLLLRRRGGAALSPYAAAIWLMALPLWLMVMVLEAGSMPGLARAFAAAVGEEERARVLLAARPLVAFGILVGYVGAFLQWKAVALWGVDILWAGIMPRWFGWWGVVGGAVAALALIPAVLLPKGALVILLATSGPAGLWTLVLAYFLWTAAPD